MPKYSIITPVYNSFSLMERYFASLENQTFKDFDVIIVDDCSTDGSYEKLKEYAAKSPLAISVYQSDKNAGPGNARNIGMDMSQGEWITFVDNDDWVETTLLEKIDEVFASYEVNCVIYDYCVTTSEKSTPAQSMYVGETGPVTISDCVKYLRNHAVGKFYKLSACREHNIRYPELRRCEDVGFVARAVVACGSAYYLNEPLYYYYQRPNSLSNNKVLDETDMVKAFGILEDALSEDYQEELTEKSVPDLLYGVLLMMCKSGKSTREINDYLDSYELKYPQWGKSAIIGYLGKAKMIFLKAAQHRAIVALRVLTRLHTLLVGRG